MKRPKSAWSWLRNLRSLRLTSAHNDRVLPETRWVAFWIVPFYLAAAIILIVWPGDTDLLFAWNLHPAMVAALLGAACAGGAYFFSRAYLARYWHTVGLGFVPAVIFSLLGGLATLIHWGSFNHISITFIAWATFFGITCWLVPWVWIRNRATDPRMPSLRDTLIDKRAVLILQGTGGILLILAAGLYIFPDTMGLLFPWGLDPLTTRILGALVAMLGATALAMGLDRRWSSIRIPLESAGLSFALVITGVIRTWSDFNLANPGTWVFLGLVVVLFVAVVVTYLWIEIR